MDDFRMEVDEHGNIKVMSYVEAVVLSKEEQEQARRVFKQLQEENDKLREFMRILHMAFVGAVNECEELDESLIWEFSGSIRKDLEKSRAKYEADRHQFDVAMHELGIEVGE